LTVNAGYERRHHDALFPHICFAPPAALLNLLLWLQGEYEALETGVNAVLK
jgi:hypothetical protein